MNEQLQIQAVLIGGPRCGEPGAHHTGVTELQFPSHCWPVYHVYALAGFEGGNAVYVYQGCVAVSQGTLKA